MRLLASLAASAILPILGRSQYITGLNFSSTPDCAQTCLASNSGSAKGCALSDFGCFCRSNSFISALSCCLEQSCNSTDQKASLAFEVALCGTYNVSVPNFLGCSPLDSTTMDAPSSASGFVLPTTLIAATAQTATTLSSYIPAYTTSNGGPVATFAGDALLSGTCTAGVFASYTMANGGIMQFPYVGCSNQEAACCPFDPGSPGPLTECPRDYYTTSSACCPSGWTVASSAVAGQTYCATSPLLNVVPAATATGPGATVVATQIYSLRFDLTQPKSKLSSGAIAGIVVGAVAGIGLLSLGAFFLWRARRHRAQAQRQEKFQPAAVAPVPTSPTTLDMSSRKAMPEAPLPSQYAQHIAEFPETSDHPRTELPGPAPKSPPGQSGGSYLTAPGSPTGSIQMTPTGFAPVSHAIYPQELPGSVHIYEHHPAFSPPRSPAGSPPRTPVSLHSPPRTPRSATFSSPDRSSTPLAINPLASHPHVEDGYVSEAEAEAEVGRAD